MKLFRATRPTELGYTYEELKSMDEISVTLIPEKKGVVFKHVEYLVESKVEGGREEMELCKANDIANLSSSLSPSSLCPSLFVPLSLLSFLPPSLQQNLKSSVRRRYRDFEDFHEVLVAKYPYRLVPRMPPKKLAGTLSSLPPSLPLSPPPSLPPSSHSLLPLQHPVHS